MIVQTQVSIQLKEGVTADLLLTPALYGVAKERGIDLFGEIARREDGAEPRVGKTLECYSKIAYCAAILAWEVDAVDHPGKGECPYTYKDFYVWAYANPREFGRTIKAILAALTGKTFGEYLAEQQEGGEAEKKKTLKGGILRRILRIGRR